MLLDWKIPSQSQEPLYKPVVHCVANTASISSRTITVGSQCDKLVTYQAGISELSIMCSCMIRVAILQVCCYVHYWPIHSEITSAYTYATFHTDGLVSQTLLCTLTITTIHT